MRWNGTVITGVPTFLYHDELLTSSADTITDPDGQGSLICRSETQTTVNWFTPINSPVATTDVGNFIQARATGPPSLSRVTLNRPFEVFPRVDAVTNGLWSCTANGMPTLSVGIYGRAQGED